MKTLLTLLLLIPITAHSETYIVIPRNQGYVIQRQRPVIVHRLPEIGINQTYIKVPPRRSGNHVSRTFIPGTIQVNPFYDETPKIPKSVDQMDPAG